MIVDVSVVCMLDRMLTSFGMRCGTIEVRSVPRSPAVRLVAVEEPGPPLGVVRGELAHDDDLVHRSRGHGDRDTTATRIPGQTPGRTRPPAGRGARPRAAARVALTPASLPT
jgi:hypothetical protein